MKASPAQRLDIVDSIARGIPVKDALRKSGLFSKTTVDAMAMKTFGSKAFRKTMREFAEALSEKIEGLAAAELETLRVGKAPAQECVEALRGVWAAFNARASRKELRASKDAISKYWSPERQRQLEERREQATLLKPGDHAKVAAAVHMERLLNPPEDERTTLGYIRTAYERDGLIGNSPAAVHLHEHRTANFVAMPEDLQKRFVGRMFNIGMRMYPDKSFPEIKAMIEAEVGTPIDVTAAPEPVRPEPIETEGPLPTPKLLEQPQPEAMPLRQEPESANEADVLTEYAIKRLQAMFPNLRRSDVLKEAEQIAAIAGKIQ